MAHEFALYAPATKYSLCGQTLITIDDHELRFRLVNVLRVKAGDVIILFDAAHALYCTITRVSKELVQAMFLKKVPNTPFTTNLIAIVPLLNKEYLENTLYGLTTLGIQHIYLSTTQKSRPVNTLPDHERLLRIIHAAQEQSKQFNEVILHAPLSLIDTIKQVQFNHANALPLLANVHGAGINSINITSTSTLVITAGPEGDYTPDEYELLQQANFIGIKLGQTVLRSCDAFFLLAGTIRALQVT